MTPKRKCRYLRGRGATRAPTWSFGPIRPARRRRSSFPASGLGWNAPVCLHARGPLTVDGRTVHVEINYALDVVAMRYKVIRLEVATTHSADGGIEPDEIDPELLRRIRWAEMAAPGLDSFGRVVVVGDDGLEERHRSWVTLTTAQETAALWLMARVGGVDPNKYLAERLGISSSAAATRVKRLREKGVSAPATRGTEALRWPAYEDHPHPGPEGVPPEDRRVVLCHGPSRRRQHRPSALSPGGERPLPAQSWAPSTSVGSEAVGRRPETVEQYAERWRESQVHRRPRRCPVRPAAGLQGIGKVPTARMDGLRLQRLQKELLASYARSTAELTLVYVVAVLPPSPRRRGVPDRPDPTADPTPERPA